MPEGHTIHRLAQDLARDFAGHRLRASSPQGRFEDAKTIDGTRLETTEAVGKHLFLNFERASVHIHLGLFGRFRRSALPGPAPTGALRLRLIGPASVWDLRGPTRCEIIDDAARGELLARLGADPLAKNSDPKPAWKAIQKTKRPIGAVLLDQRIFSGLGNVYRAEILFMLRIHPELPSNQITKKQFNAIWKLARELLARGVKEKRIVTRPAVKGRRLKRSEALYVYRRRTCPECEGPIRRWEVGSRPIYACLNCQRLP